MTASPGVLDGVLSGVLNYCLNNVLNWNLGGILNCVSGVLDDGLAVCLLQVKLPCGELFMWARESILGLGAEALRESAA